MRTNSVHLFVFDGMADWEAAFAIAGINNPQFQIAPGRYRVATVGLTTAPIVTVGGVRVQPDAALDDISPFTSSMLILPGGASWEYGANSAAHASAVGFPSGAGPEGSLHARSNQ